MNIREARLEDVQGMARVVVDTWRATYRGLMPDEHLDKLSYSDRERSFRELIKDPNDDKFKFVAEDNAGNIIGVAIGGLERSGHTIFKGEIYAIYVLEAYQRKGLGKNLVRIAIEWLNERNINSMLLWVLVGNKYQKFYAGLGGLEVDRKTFEYDKFSADLVAYGWEDISRITLKKLAFCGNDCSECLRYTATQSGDISRLEAVAKLWNQLGLRDTIMSPEEIKCYGCYSSSFCRYGIHKCASDKKIENCGECKDYPCDLTVKSFEQTQMYAGSIKGKCTEEKYRIFEMAFFSKKENLDRARVGR